jgi:hypothetical protein
VSRYNASRGFVAFCVICANSSTHVVSRSISASRANGGLDQGAGKSRHSLRFHPADRNRSTGPSASDSPLAPGRLDRRSDRRTPSGIFSSAAWNQDANASS